MSHSSRNSQDSRHSDMQVSFKRFNYEEFNEERKKILETSQNSHSLEVVDDLNTNENNQSNCFSFIRNSHKNQALNHQINTSDSKRDSSLRNEEYDNNSNDNTTKKRNMVLEILLKEKEENLFKLTQNKDLLNKELEYYKKKYEEIQDAQEIIVTEYEEKLCNYEALLSEKEEKEKQFLIENENLKKINKDLLTANPPQDVKTHQNQRARASSLHKFENTNKRYSIDGESNISLDDNYSGKLKKELDKTKKILENVYSDNERLIMLVKDLESNKKEYEKLLISKEYAEKELEKFINENEKLQEIIEEQKLNYDELYMEHEKSIKENKSLLEKVEKKSQFNKIKEQQMQTNYLTQLQELQATLQLQLKTKLKKYEDIIDSLKKENQKLKSLKNYNKENENPSCCNPNLASNTKLIEEICFLLEVKSSQNLICKIKEMNIFHKNTHKLLNSLADLMKNLVPNVTKPTLKEMWSFLKFTIQNYHETKIRYENSAEELEIYSKIKQMLNAELKEEIIYNLNNMICEKKVFTQILNKVKKIFHIKDGLSIIEINNELSKYK